MMWLTWRQFRVQGAVALGVLAAFGVFLLVTGRNMRTGLTEIRAACGTGCGDSLNSYVQEQQTLAGLVGVVLIAAPALLGMVWGAPLVAREVESGTHRLIWNQSISRTRWLLVRLLIVGAAAVLVTGVLSLMVTWWARPIDAITQDRFTPLVFEARGVVPLGYAAFAFAVGACTGLLVRRTVPAVVVTMAVVLGVQVLVPLAVRPHLMTPTTATVPVTGPEDWSKSGITGVGLRHRGSGSDTRLEVTVSMAGDWVVSGPGTAVDSSGKVARGAEICAHQGFPPPAECIEAMKIWVDVAYQPKDRYWTFQLLEAGIYVLLAGLLTWGGTAWLRRRPA
ncbi:ABC transporter permease subunit [Streptomyces sp. NPDC059578]|uniref:ABC transporter permease subunit n=1 Tax=unclassified Streptomyces TaxID=2593676 RepID=UPI003655B2D7